MDSDGLPAIRGIGLTKTFKSGDDDLIVFSDMNFVVERGERLALIGESGAGKSTLLHLLGGLDRPSNGKIYFKNTDISGLSETGLAGFRNREIGFVWQNHSLLPEFTALENVMMPLLIRGATIAEASPVSLARLDEVGLRNRASHRAGELSGGEQQRVALARALAGTPSVLLADEPTGQLTSIFVTHNLSFARRCDRILKLEKGTLTALPAGGTAEPGEASFNYGGNYV
jgi:lipoprotein-releasing system ATP-binding protein